MKRSLSNQLNEFLEIFPCVAIIGPRQCGKTTLAKEKVDWAYFDLESQQDYEQIRHDPALFLNLHPEKVIVDEAQIFPELFSALRVEIDKCRNKKGRFIITGSSSPQLLTQISETLAGRIGVLNLSPFSYQETQACTDTHFAKNIEERIAVKEWSSTGNPFQLKIKGSAENIHEYWLKGGYPEPWINSKERFRQVWMEQYVQSYINRDIARLYPSLNQERYRRFIKILASLSGQIINYSEIARALDISQPTAKDYLDIAHHTFIWRTLPAFSRQTKKRLIKHPKGILRDSGLLHHMLFLRKQGDLLNHIAMGNSWEAMVVEQVLRQFEYAGIPVEYSHYRSSGGAEVDLVIEGDFGLVPIEIKYAQSLKPGRLKGLQNFIQEFHCPYGLVLHNSEEFRALTESIFAIPIRAV